MIRHTHNLGILFLLLFWIIGCGSDESSPPGLPANVLGSWSGTWEGGQAFKLNVTSAIIDSSTPAGSVKIDGTIEIGFAFLPLPIPDPLSIPPEDQACSISPIIPFQSTEVQGSEIIFDMVITICLRNQLPPIQVPFFLKGNVIGNQITGSFEIPVVHPAAPNGGFKIEGTFILVNQAGPSPSFNNLKNGPLDLLDDWNGEWSNDVTKESGTIAASIKEIFVTPDTPLEVLELGISISLSPISTQCFSDLVDLASSGEIKGNTFTLKAPFNGQDISISFQGIRENSKISGTFEITGTEGTCLGHTGTWRILQ